MIEIYLVGFLFTWVFAVGAFQAYWMEKYPTVSDFREELGASVGFGFAVALMWPIGLLLIPCLTGFLKYGWYLTPREKSAGDSRDP